ncbi:hypothetical protein DDQ68_04490 [Hymenobacter nivis]|uniref:Uncharacterized protein n=1 Tax=Hymenobacter nivis TaxID=1850093 RepID=A0A2Z3GLQ6_9BACT|nr:hypothetical protein DDQ68_04490 [Hymenobacter nivis]
MVATGWFKGTVPGSKPGEHAWNLVKINGQWGNLDVLCYDPLYPTYDFLLDPNEFQRTHYANKFSDDEALRILKQFKRLNRQLSYFLVLGPRQATRVVCSA